MTSLQNVKLKLILKLSKVKTMLKVLHYSGYGDVSCQTVLGKMFLILFILVGLVGSSFSLDINVT